MIYIITFQNKQNYIDMNNFEILKTNKEFSYTFYPNCVLIRDKSNSTKHADTEYKKFLLDELKRLKETRTQVNILREADNILKQLMDFIQKNGVYNLETLKIRLKNTLKEYMNFIQVTSFDTLKLNEVEFKQLLNNIHTSTRNAKYDKLKKIALSRRKQIDLLVSANEQYTPKEYEGEDGHQKVVDTLFRTFQIKNYESTFFTEQYFETIDTTIPGYYTIQNYNETDNLVFQTHFYDYIMDDKESKDLFFEYSYLLNKSKLHKIIQYNNNITYKSKEEEDKEIQKQLRQDYLNQLRTINISQEEWVSLKYREYKKETENQLKLKCIQYLNDKYKHNTKILQQINKNKQNFNDILTGKNTSMWFIHLQFDFVKDYENISSINKIKKSLKTIDDKDKTKDRCIASKRYFSDYWIDTINNVDSNLNYLVHDDPRKLKRTVGEFKNYIRSLLG